MATVCEVRTLLFLKDVVFNKRKSIFIKVSFYRRVASRSRRRLYSIVRSIFCCERKIVVPGKDIYLRRKLHNSVLVNPFMFFPIFFCEMCMSLGEIKRKIYFSVFKLDAFLIAFRERNKHYCA